MKNHEYSWELLYHFNCGECKNWWSYSTTETQYQWRDQTMSCPHCGYRTNIKPKDTNGGFPIVRNPTPKYPLHSKITKDMDVDSKIQPSTADEKARFVANELYHESNDRDDFAAAELRPWDRWWTR